VKPYIAGDLPNLDLAVGNVTTVDPSRTFWDKVVILHGLRRWWDRRGELRGGGLPEMRVEVVQHKVNHERRRIHRLHKVLDEGHKVNFGATGGDLARAAFALGFDGYKEIARPVAPVGNRCVAATLGIDSPLFGKIQITIQQRRTLVAGVAEKHANLAVLDAPRRAGVLALDPDRMLALLQKARLIGNQHRIWTAQLFQHVIAQPIPRRV
jgi:hypothetical protein